jgi:ATP-dependent helicase Lhr and Lhr-like helicase
MTGETDPMTDSALLERELREHASIRNRMPNSWGSFFSRFGRLRPVQLGAIPRVLDGENLLITAPTAGGKTEAAVAPLCERMVGERWPGLSVLLITPTRSLVNDLYYRLAPICDQLGVSVGRKTGDHPNPGPIRERLLITTPESTESLLTFRREGLAGLRAVILDEIHLLDGSPRGDQLRLILGRLQVFLRSQAGSNFAGLQRLALSATVPDPERVARAYLGPGAGIISVVGQREIEARVLVAEGDERERSGVAVEAAGEFPDVKKVLVFVNSRRQVDCAANDFRQGRFANVPVHGHHGSLSRSRREDAEARFKSDSRALCVATMTLEIGIDIGDVDLVICMDPPSSLASFLQRIGRGCRRRQGRTRVLCIARDRAGELTFEAMIRQAGIGLPPMPTPPVRRSVLLQQVLAYLRQVDKNCRTLDQFANVLTSPEEPRVSRELVENVLGDMTRTGLLALQDGLYVPASEGREFIESLRIYSNINATPAEVSLVDAETGQVVARMAAVGLDGPGVRVAGQPFKVLPGGTSVRHAVRGNPDCGGAPRYHPRSVRYAQDVWASLAGLMGVAPGTLIAVPAGTGITVVTWLGRLRNSILAEGLLRKGYKVKATHIALVVPGCDASEILPLMKEAVASLEVDRRVGAIPDDRLADLGPHVGLLSSEGQRLAREDWVDLDTLRIWAESLHIAEMVDANSTVGKDLLVLIAAY